MTDRSTHAQPGADPELEIIDISPEWHDAFRSLNQEWIDHYFQMEEADHEALGHPDEHILKPGGAILMALRNGQAVGTCALIRMENDTLELAKMAVAPHVRGQGIGWALSQAALQRARAMGAKKVYLGSNSKLQPAIRMYKKLGFHHVHGRPTEYSRCDVQMEMDL